MREIIAIIILIILRWFIDLDDGGFNFAIPMIIGTVTLIYLCCALIERFGTQTTIQTWFRIDPERPPLPHLPDEEEAQDDKQNYETDEMPPNDKTDEKLPKYW